VANRGHGRVAVQESGGKSQEGRCIECVWRLRPLSSLRSLARRRRLQHRRSIAPCHGPPRRLETTLKEPWRRPPCVAGVSGELSLRAGLERLSAYRRASGPEWLDHHQAVEHRGLYRRCPGRAPDTELTPPSGFQAPGRGRSPFPPSVPPGQAFGNTPAVVRGRRRTLRSRPQRRIARRRSRSRCRCGWPGRPSPRQTAAGSWSRRWTGPRTRPRRTRMVHGQRAAVRRRRRYR
jgi:hypothetical protein